MEEEHCIEVQTETDYFCLKGRPCELSAMSFVPIKRVPRVPKERTVFNSVPGSSEMGESSADETNTHITYDRLFGKQDVGYNAKLHRDDREHAKSRNLYVHKEETQKEVPTLGSSEYGHRLDMFKDPPGRKHVRIGHVKAEFYRRNGITS